MFKTFEICIKITMFFSADQWSLATICLKIGLQVVNTQGNLPWYYRFNLTANKKVVALCIFSHIGVVRILDLTIKNGLVARISMFFRVKFLKVKILPAPFGAQASAHFFPQPQTKTPAETVNITAGAQSTDNSSRPITHKS